MCYPRKPVVVRREHPDAGGINLDGAYEVSRIMSKFALRNLPGLPQLIAFLRAICAELRTSAAAGAQISGLIMFDDV